MNDDERVLIVIATYNEAESLPGLVNGLRSELPSAQILIIDDNSPDGTGTWALAHAETDASIDVFIRAGKLGLGSAAVAGFKAAIKDDFTWVATLDADLSHDPTALKKMYDMAVTDKTDVVIGSRYVTGGKIIGWPVYRLVSSYLVNLFARLALGLETRDNTSAMRIYRVDRLRQIEVDSLRSVGYSYLEEILMKLKKDSAKMKEYPITFQNRETGRSKADVFEVGRSLYQILRLSLGL